MIPLFEEWIKRSFCLVDVAVLCPSAQLLAEKDQRDCERDPEKTDTCVHHDWSDISNIFNPDIQELCHAVSPKVLVNSSSNKKFSRHRFIRINLTTKLSVEMGLRSLEEGVLNTYSVRSSNSGHRRELDSYESVASDDNGFPWPSSLVANRHDETPK
jgi:hypothetical protein